MSNINITLLVPGYQCDPYHGEHGESSVNSPVVPLMRWVKDSLQLPWQARLNQLLGLADGSGRLLPVAQLAPQFIGRTQRVVCADPIHLRAGRDTATLLPPEMLALSENEADELLITLNAFVQEDGLHFTRDGVTRWYLVGSDASELLSFPPSFLANRSVSSFLPEGEDSGRWRRLMTELQILLHTHPINQERELHGKLPVNSVWFWGGGKVPHGDESTLGDSLPHDSSLQQGSLQLDGDSSITLYTDDAFAMALAAQCHVPCEPLASFQPSQDSVLDTHIFQPSQDSILDTHIFQPSQEPIIDTHSTVLEPLIDTRKIVIVDTRILDAQLIGDELGIREAQQCVNNDWIGPLTDLVRSGQVTSVGLFNEDGEQGTIDQQFVDEQRQSANLISLDGCRVAWKRLTTSRLASWSASRLVNGLPSWLVNFFSKSGVR